MQAGKIKKGVCATGPRSRRSQRTTAVHPFLASQGRLYVPTNRDMRVETRLQPYIGPTLAFLLLALAGFAVYTSTGSQRLTDEVRRSAELAVAYDHVRDGMTEQAMTLQEFIDGQRTAIRSDLEHEREAVLAAASVLADLGERDIAEDVRAAEQGYTTELGRALEFSRAGNRERAEWTVFRAISSAALLTERTHRLSHAAHDDHLAALARLDARQRHLFTIACVLVPIALLAAYALFVLLRRRQRREVAALAEAALTDGLTGLRNLRALHADLDGQEPGSVAVVDRDDLKVVNDREGHAAGDRNLCERAAALGRIANATAYRIGGDEFVVVAPRSTAWELLARVQTALSGLQHARASAGLAEHEPGLSPDALVRRADLALLEAKRGGRTTQVWVAGLDAAAEREGDRRRDRAMAAALAKAVDARDHQTRSHCETVAALCERMARALGLDEERVAQMRLAGMLHDVGKIGIPDAILLKPGPLEPEEFALMQSHSALGEEIVRAAGFRREATWIRHHHERVGGGGYPDGLAGEEIPLEARILHVADAYEAMTAGRRYQAARTPQGAIGELLANVGTQFDFACVQALCAVVDAQRLRRPSPEAHGISGLATTPVAPVAGA